MKHLARATTAAATAIAAALLTASPAALHAQAGCTAATGDVFVLPGATQCALGGVNLTWSSFSLNSVADMSGLLITPFTGSDAFGTYFGFKVERPRGGALYSASLSAVDAVDAMDPSTLTRNANQSLGLYWGFDFALPGGMQVTRSAVTTVNSMAAATSQQRVDPDYVAVFDPSNGDFLGENPIVGSGCGWTGATGYDGTSYDAANACGFLTASSNNWIWDLASGDAFGGIAWSVAGAGGDQYGNPDTASRLCQDDAAGLVPYVGSTCEGHHGPLAPPQFLSHAEGGSIVEALAMSGNNSPATGYIDPSNLAAINASSSIDYYEARLYYTPSVTATPEPATIALFGTGLLALGGIAARRRRSTNA